MRKLNKYSFIYSRIRAKHPDWKPGHIRYYTIWAMGGGTANMDYKTYQKNVFETLSSFDAAFHPYNKWKDVKLSTICPCNTCEVSKELMDRQYEVQMSGGLQEEITKPCEHCLDAVLWKAECVQKLAWYEEHDERLKL